MNGPYQGGWNDQARRFAFTILILAIALSFAAKVFVRLAPTLITLAVLGAAVYGVVLVVRYRRSRWW